MKLFVKLTTIKIVSKNGNVFRLPKKFIRYLSKVLDKKQALELSEKLIDYISDKDVYKMTELIGKFTDKMLEESFLTDLNKNTNALGIVDWDTFFSEY